MKKRGITQNSQSELHEISKEIFIKFPVSLQIIMQFSPYLMQYIIHIAYIIQFFTLLYHGKILQFLISNKVFVI